MGTAKASGGARWVVTLSGALALGGLGCGAGAVPTDAPAAESSVDAPLDAADSGVLPPCTRNADCDDGRFCNGPERCAPGDMEADERGCVRAAMPACRSNELCNEAMQRCTVNPDAGESEADAPVECDRDNDGVRAATPECGGADCDDNDRNRYPGNPERCDIGGATSAHDEDCNPCTVAGASPDGDEDHDDFVSRECSNPFPEGSAAAPMGCDLRAVVVAQDARIVRGIDCDDGNRSRNPNVPEVCGNNVDDNCVNGIDEAVAVVAYRDRDGDGFGNREEPSMGPVSSCPTPAGYVLNSDDCDDGPAGAFTFPGATEICDRVINDCTARTPGGSTVKIDEDEDNDGFSSDRPTSTCVGRGATTSATALPKTDCDDTRADVHPGAAEVCDGVDNDCSAASAEEGAQVNCAADLECHVGRCGFVGSITARDNATCAITRPRELLCWGGDGDEGWYMGTRYAPLPAARVLFDWNNLSIVEFSPGGNHACAITTGGELYCAGTNLQGQIGVATPSNVQRPRAVTGLGRVVSTSVGNVHSCAASADRLVRCWGGNASGQLGDGTTTNRSTPAVVSGLTDVVRVAAGTNHTCAIDRAGAVYCWGLNTSGAVGAGDTLPHPSPVRVTLPAPASDVVANSQTTCALLRDGTVACWGINNNGQASASSPATAGNAVLVPVRIAGVANARQVSVGATHACALVTEESPTRRDAVWCWGSNAEGQLGRASSASAPAAAAVAGVSDVTSVVTGARHSCALRRDGLAVCWGDNQYGQSNPSASRSSQALTAVPLSTRIPAQIVVGLQNACVRRVDGRLYCAGSNATLVLGTTATSSAVSMVRVPGLWDVSNVALWSYHACAVLGSDGSVMCWGASSDRGQLGDGTFAPHATPAPVMTTAAGVTPAVRLTGASQVVTGALFSCARLDDGTARCWGQHGTLGEGAMGGGSGTGRNLPVTVQGLTEVEELATMNATACARLRSGTVRCWGELVQGETGSSPTPPAMGASRYALAPVPVLREAQGSETAPVELTGVLRLFAGGEHACVVRNDNATLCWGQSDNGTNMAPQDSFNRTPLRVAARRSTIPLTVMSLSGYAAAGFGAGQGASVFTWGLPESATPVLLRPRSSTETMMSTGGVRVTLPAPVDPSTWPFTFAPREIAVGSSFALVASITGEIYAWGNNGQGATGVGSLTSSLTVPTPVVFVNP